MMMRVSKQPTQPRHSGRHANDDRSMQTIGLLKALEVLANDEMFMQTTNLVLIYHL